MPPKGESERSELTPCTEINKSSKDGKKVKGRPYFFVIITRLHKNEFKCLLLNKVKQPMRTKELVGTTLNFFYHP